MTEGKKAFSAEQRTQQLVGLAYDLAEKRLIEGTASSAEVVHFLKMGTQESKLKESLLESQATLATSKAAAIEDARSNEISAKEAIEALKDYSPTKDE